MKILLAIENDYSLERADYVNAFIRDYEGEVIVMTGFGQRKESEIFKAVSKCTDIAVQTCFVNGSENQFAEMVGLLTKMKHPINVYIAYLGISHRNELREFIVNNLSPEELVSIEHHSIYAMSRDTYQSITDKEPHLLLNFDDITKPIHKKHTKKRVHDLYLEWYRDTAINRPTGRKILVLGCNASGKAFSNLPIGKVVDELEAHELSSGGISRGVWIMGNGEPIMLINDGGFSEYKIADKLSMEEILQEIGKTTTADLEKLKLIEVRGLIAILEDEEDSPITKANIICEELGIEKRFNRSKICKLIEDNI